MKRVIAGTSICLVIVLCVLSMSRQPVTQATGSAAPSDMEARVFFPSLIKMSISTEWSQFGANAQRTSWMPQTLTNWQYRCAWNGYGATSHITLPRIEPVTGGGQIYVAAGANGLYAISENNCSQAWNVRHATFNSTVAYDDGAVFALGTSGVLYKLSASNGAILSQFSGASNAGQHLAPVVLPDRVIFASGQYVYAVSKADLAQLWRYDAGARVDTPPSYSSIRDLVVVVTNDLYVHAIDNGDGARLWRTKPTPRSGGTIGPREDPDHAAVENGYPAIADKHGIVFVRYQLDWNTIYVAGRWQPDNVWIRNLLANNRGQQNVFALSLDSGAQAFIVNVGQGGIETASVYIEQGRSPVVRVLPNGKQVAYAMCRGTTTRDARWDSHMCEIVLDNTTVPGLLPGYVRYIAYEHPPYVADQYLITDEQPYVTGAGSQLLGGHWQAGQTLQITDRSDALGSLADPIQSVNMPSVVEREKPSNGSDCTQNNATHSCGDGLLFYDESAQGWGGRLYTPGFWVHWGTTTPGSAYWSTFIVSKNLVIYKSFSDAVFVMQGQASAPASVVTPIPSARTPAPPPATSANAAPAR